MAPDNTSPADRAAVHPVRPSQLAWLERELAAWRADGVVDDAQVRAIGGRYVAVRRLSLTKLLLYLGGGFLGVGLIWLVAANLDQMSPLLRFLAVTVLWLGAVAGAEALSRRGRAAGRAGGASAGPLVEAVHLVAALAFGAVVFQAAQSLQVPAYEPALVGLWGLGALLYAYAVARVAPLLVGIVAATGWYVWEVLAEAEDGMGFVLPVLLAAAVAGAVGVVHVDRGPRGFATGWRQASALLVLLGLFVAAFPYVDMERFTWTATVVVGTVVAVLAAGVAAALSAPGLRVEALMPVVAGVAGVVLVLWEPPAPVLGVVAAEGYAHAFVSVAVYVVAAGWYAVLGVRRDSSALTALATAALVLFTTVQSFAVFAPIVTGAALFLVLGVVLLVSGYLFDRGRRRLVASLEGAS